MKKFILFFFLLSTPFIDFAQNTIGGKTSIVPEEEVTRQSAFLDAERERMLEHFDKATELYKKFLLENPTNDAAWYGLSRTQFALKDEVNAMVSVNKAIEADPKNIWYQTFYADLLEKGGRTKDAYKVYENLIKQNPNIPDFYQRQAYLAVLSGDPKSGLKALDKLESLIGFNEEIASKRHMIYVGMGDLKKAAAELQRIADNDPEDPQHLHQLAAFYDQMGEKANATAVYKKILKNNPDDSAAQMALIEKNKGSNNEDAFLDALKPLFRDPKVSIDAKIKELFPYFTKLEKGNDPALSQKLLELGAILETSHSDDAKAWSVSGDILYLSNQPEKALEKYKKCIQMNVPVFPVWENAMDILNDAGNHSELYKIAEKALDAFPNQPKAYYYYGMAANQTNRHEQALEQLEQATLMAGNNIALKLDIIDQIGIAYLKKKDFAEAKSRLDAALSKGGDKHPGILEHLGDAEAQLGNKNKAIEYWKKSYELKKSPSLQQKISAG